MVATELTVTGPIPGGSDAADQPTAPPPRPAAGPPTATQTVPPQTVPPARHQPMSMYPPARIQPTHPHPQVPPARPPVHGQPAHVRPDGTAGGPSSPTLFARLLAEAGVSDTRFARQVNTRARSQRRIELGLARTTVGHWRRGMRPRDPMVAELAAAELSAIVGYPVAPADLGWRGEAYERDDLGLAVADQPDDTLRTLAGLSGRDMRRRDVLHDGAAFVASAFADPVLSSMTGVIRRIGTDAAPSPSGGAMIRDMTETFRKLDARFGSSEIRPQVVAFLHDRTRAAGDGHADADTFSALAELAQFTGWLAQDCNRQTLAQRYYIQALTLAEHANDVMIAGRVLSAMSDQAASLGHPRHSLALARAAIDRAARHSAPAVQAMLQDRLAWALARNGDEADCTQALKAMEKAIARAPDGDAPSWAGHYNQGDVAECQGHCFLLLGQPALAEQRLLEGRELQGQARARSRIYAEADLALAYLRRPKPDLEAALEAGYQAVEMAGQVSSTRITTKLTELDAAMARYQQVVAAREWRSQAAGLVRHPGGQAPAAI